MIARTWDCPAGVNMPYLWKYNNSFRKCVWANPWQSEGEGGAARKSDSSL